MILAMEPDGAGISRDIVLSRALRRVKIKIDAHQGDPRYDEAFTVLHNPHFSFQGGVHKLRQACDAVAEISGERVSADKEFEQALLLIEVQAGVRK